MADSPISENVSYISAEEFVVRNTDGVITSFNYSGIFSKMKNYLMQFYDDESYKGRCNNFIHVFGRFYEKSYYGEFGKMMGTLVKITKGRENLTYAMGVTNVNTNAYSTTRSIFTYPHIITKKMTSFDIEYRKIKCTFIASTSSDEAKIKIVDSLFSINLSSYNGSLSSSKIKVYDSPTVFNLDFSSEPCEVEIEGTSFSTSTAREPWNATNNSYCDYMKHTIKKKYK